MERKNKISDKLKLNTKVRAGLIIIGIVLFAAGTAELCKSFSTKEIVLEKEDVEIIENVIKNIQEIVTKENPPEVLNEKICKKCSYYDLCYV